MDLNRLFFEHQLALIRSARTNDSAERDRYNDDADTIASRISGFQSRSGARAAPLLPAAAL
jgi:hypothetical protein